MGHHHTPDVDPQTVADHQKMWDSFVIGGKITVISVTVILVGLALAFVKFF